MAVHRAKTGGFADLIATGSGNTFAADIETGLFSNPKYLPSKYFYDEQGSALFKQIMALPDYYLTNSETEIFEQHADDILKAFHSCGTPFHLIELGAGDASKTEYLIRHFLAHGIRFAYNPVDISPAAVQDLVTRLVATYPRLDINPVVDDYMHGLDKLAASDSYPRIVLFLGSSIGNFTTGEAIAFCREIGRHLNLQDRLFVGFDLKKDPQIIARAYDDPAGITAAFNFNLLTRINRELDANFNLADFCHAPLYDPQSGQAKSYLVSTKNQAVTLQAIGRTVRFRAWEAMQTEVSEKYDRNKIEHIAGAAGFTPIGDWSDSRHYFLNALWQKAEA